MVHVNELHHDRAQMALRHHAVYKTIWQDVESRIQAGNAAGVQCIEYRVCPLHIVIGLGQPLVSSQRAARYVRDKLLHNGFQVMAWDFGQAGVLMFIDWSTPVDNMRNLLTATVKKQQQPQAPPGPPIIISKSEPPLPPPPPQQQQPLWLLDQLARVPCDKAFQT